MDTNFAQETTNKYHKAFLELMDAHVPQGNQEYLRLYAEFSDAMLTVYGNNGGNAISESGKAVISMNIEMIQLAYPNILIPK